MHVELNNSVLAHYCDDMTAFMWQMSCTDLEKYGNYKATFPYLENAEDTLVL